MSYFDNADMTENELREMKSIMSAASDILVFADNTEKSLREKLLRKGYDKKLVDSALVKLKVSGLVDDARFMSSYIDYLASKKFYGKARIKLELQKKGIGRELISEHFDDCIDDIDFKENCVKLICKKKLNDKIRDSKTASAVTAALVRYGYGYAEIKYAYTRLLEENEEE